MKRCLFLLLVSILETGLKLGVVFLLPIINFDKLSLYGGLMFIVPLLSTLMYKAYCNKKFENSKYEFQWDKKLFMQLTTFSGWSMMGATANIGALQGGNILLNLFTGVVANASFGIATQVSTAVSTFSSNLLIAFNPQIIKNYSIGDKDNTFKLIIERIIVFLLFSIINCYSFFAEYRDNFRPLVKRYTRVCSSFLPIDDHISNH